jgi:rhamnosyltransferase
VATALTNPVAFLDERDARTARQMPELGSARPRILVLLAAFNGARWIREQLESILNQDGVDIRIVVRDDGSTDATRAEVGLLDDERVSLSPPVAPGGSAAQNFFALIRENAADGFDFVGLADQDDIWNRDKLSRACNTLSGTRSAGYSSATTAIWTDGRELVLRQRSTPTPSDFLFEGAGQGCTFVLPVDFYKRFRLFVTEHRLLTRSLHYHDWAVYAVARAWEQTWSFDSAPSVKYRQHSDNDTGARTSVSGVTKRVSLMRRGWYRTQLRAIAELCWAAAPANTTVAEWRAVLARSDSWPRRFQAARFCLQGGRRKAVDNVMVVFATLAGWI